jgi:hypothetical protein
MGETLTAWGGYRNGKLHIVIAHDDGGPTFRMPQIFTNKRDADRQYDDVRRVEIRTMD